VVASAVYLYGMTVVSTIHKLVGAFPDVDGYGEIEESYEAPGGEAMNAAVVLASLGLSTQIGGPKFGRETEAILRRYADRYGIDVSSVTTDSTYPGVRDCVLVDDRHRTVFGQFRRYFQCPVRRWDEPDPEGISRCSVVCIDPFFGESSSAAAALASASRRPYVTIDCPLDSPLHRGAASTVVSREYRRRQYPGRDDEALLNEYRKGGGLTVFTSGRDDILYGRVGQPVCRFAPLTVQATSTLGAGDVFRAGLAYAVVENLTDDEGVRFASALAAVACTRMPIADRPPTLGEVREAASASAGGHSI